MLIFNFHLCTHASFLDFYIVSLLKQILRGGNLFGLKRKKKIFTKNEKYLLGIKKAKKEKWFSCIKMSPLYCYTNISNWLIFT